LKEFQLTNSFNRCIIAGTFLIVYFIVNIFYDFLVGENPSGLTLSQLAEAVSKEYSWLLRLTINCIGYSAVVVPGFLIFKYTRKTKYLERSGKKCHRHLALSHFRSVFRAQHHVRRRQKLFR
jgi:hypothetical protein